MPLPTNDSSTKKRVVRKTKDGKTVVVKRRIRKIAKKEPEDVQTKFIKYMALFLLITQMCGLVMLMRYSRTVKRPENTPLYLSSSAVFVMEIMKFVICSSVVAWQSGGNLLNQYYIHVYQSPYEMLKLCVPSLLYTVQNNLLYLALTNLDAATYQVCYQLKIITTALFSALLLGRTFSKIKWMSLVVLTVGVAIVQLSGSGDQHTTSNAQEDDSHHKARFVGLVAVLCAACTSGFSGVYFEKILKGSQTTLWVRNIQMGIPSIIIAYVTCLTKDYKAIVEGGGFLQGYTTIVWIVVLVQAAGGLIVAVVVKYADNVLKVFATSFSIVLSCIISSFLFDFRPDGTFVIGATFVVLATAMYSKPENSSTGAKRVRRLRKKSLQNDNLLPTTSLTSSTKD